ncbi:MAG: 4-hydroxy-tetrahydrodipicolinate reductase, partial [Fidelibacterota bacterium]
MRYGIIGINGRMGQEIKGLFDDQGHDLVFSYDKDEEFRQSKPEIIIDFSLPNALDKTLNYVQEFNCGLIIGTTGLSQGQFDQLEEISQKVPVVQAYNYSIGIQMLLKATELLNQHISDWDIEITETHHRFKKDKPSGTAKMLQSVFDREIPVNSLRLGNVPGDHSVHFGSLGET